jgi:hypothetical protein
VKGEGEMMRVMLLTVAQLLVGIHATRTPLSDSLSIVI